MNFISEIFSKLSSLFSDIFSLEIIFYYLSFVPLVLLLEMLIVGWKESSLKKILQFRKTVRTDLFFFLFDLFNVYNLTAILFSFGIFHILSRVIFKFTNFELIHTIQDPYIQFTVLYLISDFKNYISHYIFHRYNSLWALHELHHSATEFCILTRFRGHFLETAMLKMFNVLPYAIFGSVESFLLISVLSEIHQLFLHSAVKSNWGWVGKYILVSPNAHRIHHSIERKHYGKNFGNTFIFWDRIFNTYHPPQDINEVGVELNKYNKDGFFKDLLLSVKHFITLIQSDLSQKKHTP